MTQPMRPCLSNIYFTKQRQSLKNTNIKLEQKAHEQLISLTKDEIVNYIIIADKSNTFDEITKIFLEKLKYLESLYIII